MDTISTEQFLCLLYDKQLKEEEINSLRRMGIIEEYDIINLGEPIVRKSAARIIHEYLIKELKKEDLEDISGAAVLRDLYDCRVCVNHIAQVYLRGIMKGKAIPGLSENGFIIFDANSVLELDEAILLKNKIYGFIK